MQSDINGFNLEDVTIDELVGELERRGGSYIHAIPTPTMIRELILRDVKLSDIFKVGLEEKSHQEHAFNNLNTSAQQNDPENDDHFPDPNQDIINKSPDNEGRFDLKQYPVEHLGNIAYEMGLITKSMHADIKNPKTKSNHYHPFLVYKIAAMLPRSFYISDQSVPFAHYHTKEFKELPVHFLNFQTYNKQLIKQWEQEGLQRAQSQDEQMRQEVERQNEEDEGEELSSMNEGEEQIVYEEYDQEDIDLRIEETERKRRQDKKRSREQQVLDDIPTSRKRSRLNYDSDEEPEPRKWKHFRQSTQELDAD